MPDKTNILLTGYPGVGKTTIVKKIIEHLSKYNPVGFYTQEIRDNRKRKGFELVSLNGDTEPLAHVNMKTRYKVSKYYVNVTGFDEFLERNELLNPESDLVIMDEIGRMECYSKRFKQAVIDLLDSEKIIIATITRRGKRFINRIKHRNDVELFNITKSNRDYIFSEITDYLDGVV